MSDNPLKQYFRSAAIHLALPSNGQFYPGGSITMPETGEVPVYPMTAIDEITYKTPDALFNGSAVVDVIKSCVPAIHDPWQMPTVDMNTILAAIRIATIGQTIPIESQCPKCNEVTDYEFDLRVLIDKKPDVSAYNKSMDIGDLKIFFRPLSYKEVNENNQTQFEEQKLAQVLNSSAATDEDKITVLSEAFTRIAAFTVNTIARSINSIQTPSAVVNDPTFIIEFLRNAEADTFNAIKARIIKLKSIENIEPLHITCPVEECGHKYDQAIMLDMTSFFARNS
jgi:hypothetical protein